MSLRFYIGSSGAGKSRRLQEDIIRRSIEEPERHFFVLVPDQFTMATQKEMIERHPAHGFMNIDIFSIGRLAHYIFEEVGRPGRLTLDDTGKNLILRKLASEMEEELPNIGSHLKKNGYIHEVKSVISEFMQYGLDVKAVGKLCDAVSEKPVLQGKLKDISLLYERFLKYLGEKYITTEETMDLLAEALDKSDLIRGSVVALDGFTGFTPVQYKVIGKLLSLCDEVIMTVIFPAEQLGQPVQKEDETDLFALSRKTVQTMEKIASELKVERGKDELLTGCPVIRYKDRHALAHLEENIFRSGAKPYPSVPDGLFLFSAMSPREEMREVCIRIRRLIREKKYAYRDIAVVTGDLQRYAPYVPELAEKYDIPVFLDNNRSLGLNPFTEYIKSGLKIIQNNFSYESVVHFLKCGLTGIEQEKIDRLENYMLALKIRGERAWNREFTRYPAYMKKDEAALQEINETRENVMEILTPLLALKKGGAAEQMTAALYHFIADHDIYGKLENYRSYFKEQGDKDRENEYGQIYQYLMELLEQIAALLEGEKLTLEEFIEIIEAGILEIQVGILPQDIDRVVIGDIERTRLKQVKVLFFIGVNEGIIPKRNETGGMISDVDREYIFDNGFELAPTPRQKAYIQRLYLYMNLSKPSGELYISYANVDGKGKALKPSYLIRSLKKMFPELKEYHADRENVMEDIAALKDGKEYLAHMIREYAGQTLQKEQKPVFAALYHEYEKQDAGILEGLKEAAFYMYEDKPLERNIARALYGAILENSISRMETYARCAYAHFLQYGMRLAEREDYSFGSLDMGNFFHQALERFGLKLKERGYSWTDFTREQAEEILKEVLGSIADEYGESVIYQDAKTAYQLKRIHRILLRAVENLKYHIKKGKFIPRELEVSFRKEINLDQVRPGLDEDEKMMLRGTIDRYDTYEKEDKIYVKVIDYKSRDKKIDLIQLYHGMQLQLAVYLNQAVERVQRQNPNKQAVPAALFYYPVMDPMMKQEDANVTGEEWERWMHEQLRVSGLVADDIDIMEGLAPSPDEIADVVSLGKKKEEIMDVNDLNIISSYVNQIISEIGNNILKGEHGARPCGEDACIYCTFKEICCYDKKLPGFSQKKLESLKNPEALRLMAEKMKGSTES